MAKDFPENYSTILNQKLTEQAIKFVKDTFQNQLSSELRLSRVTSPLFVRSNSGINDDLNGIERPVKFEIGNMNNQKMEIVQSLAKWKRMALADYGYTPRTGIYTDMNAIRPDDTIDSIHSIYVDQWDWEMVMDNDDRNLAFLKNIVSRIYQALKRTEFLVAENFPSCYSQLPENITFIHTEDALKMYPELSPEEREKKLAKKYGAIFLIGIGNPLSNGKPHSGRAPDYDDWSTKNEEGYIGLNGDIIVYDHVREDSLELSSMGIRVNPETLLRQLAITGTEERKELYWHKKLINNEFPQTIGGGIGQSRLCMFLLHKAHIGEVQASVWPPEHIAEAAKHNIVLI